MGMAQAGPRWRAHRVWLMAYGPPPPAVIGDDQGPRAVQRRPQRKV